MSYKRKKLPGNGAASENVLGRNKNDSITNTIKPPKKSEVVLLAFLKRNAMNTFQANREYGDTCLHSAVSTLEQKHGIKFRHEPEKVVNRIGKLVRVMRYHLIDVEKAKQLVARFQRERGFTQEAA